VTETRQFTGSLEIRGDVTGRRVSGVAAPYNMPTLIQGWQKGYTETLTRGSFDLARSTAPLHGGHEAEMPVSAPGRLWETDRGLFGEWQVSRTTAGDDLLVLIQDRAVNGLSVGFTANPDMDVWNADRSQVTRYGARLFHVAAVITPAYPGAQVLSVRDGNSKEPYGPVTYGDPGYQPDKKKRYPLDTEEHVHAALSYFGQAKNREPYTAEQVAAILGRIHAAAKRFGIKVASAPSSPRAARQLLECRASLYARQNEGTEPWRGVADARLAQSFLEGRQ
jgi:HK97 family phage prohead protease